MQTHAVASVTHLRSPLQVKQLEEAVHKLQEELAEAQEAAASAGAAAAEVSAASQQPDSSTRSADDNDQANQLASLPWFSLDFLYAIARDGSARQS